MAVLRDPRRRRLIASAPVAAVVTVGVLLAGSPAEAFAGSAGAAAPADRATYPSDTRPDLVAPLSGYAAFWRSDGLDDLHGTVVDAATLSRDDRLTVWINGHATAAERFKALQDAQYLSDDGRGYDQSSTVSTGLGRRLSRLYLRGRASGALPLTTALINSSSGSTGAYESTAAAKAAYSHPRPFLKSDPDAAPVPGNAAACDPSAVNASSQRAIRVGQPYADASGNLRIVRVPKIDDTTHQFAPYDVELVPAYGSASLCTGGSFPSGHTTTAYEAGITLATLLPRLAPTILARASENGNDRIVLGVHYPLDVMGGRIAGEIALAARWSDRAFRRAVLLPARVELRHYLRRTCGGTLRLCLRHQQPYTSNPYGGRSMPGGTAQIVTDRQSAVRVYRERMTYGFPRTGRLGLAASVPADAGYLLRSTFRTLSNRQRRSVLAQTEIGSGYPLDLTGRGGPAWERLDLAAAMSARVRLYPSGRVVVVRTGVRARVIRVA